MITRIIIVIAIISTISTIIRTIYNITIIYFVLLSSFQWFPELQPLLCHFFTATKIFPLRWGFTWQKRSWLSIRAFHCLPWCFKIGRVAMDDIFLPARQEELLEAWLFPLEDEHCDSMRHWSRLRIVGRQWTKLCFIKPSMEIQGKPTHGRNREPQVWRLWQTSLMRRPKLTWQTMVDVIISTEVSSPYSLFTTQKLLYWPSHSTHFPCQAENSQRLCVRHLRTSFEMTSVLLRRCANNVSNCRRDLFGYYWLDSKSNELNSDVESIVQKFKPLELQVVVSSWSTLFSEATPSESLSQAQRQSVMATMHQGFDGFGKSWKFHLWGIHQVIRVDDQTFDEQLNGTSFHRTFS